MALGALNWQTATVTFSGSLDTKGDIRLGSPPDLDIARDVQFEEIGGLQTRPPFGAVMGAGAIFGGGTLSNCRDLAIVNGELCVFTDTALYSWNAQLSKWVLRGTHLAVAVDETPRCVTTGDQVDGDRAELAGTIVYAWTEGAQVYAAAIDKVTGSMLANPTAASTAIGRPRLVALASKILLFVEATTTLLTVRAIDPAAPATGIGGAGTTVLNTDFNLYFDVVRAGTQDLVIGACRRVTTTSYTVFTVTPALAVTTSTKARTCDGPIAVATIADGTQTQIVRGNGTNVQGDLLTTSTLADVFTGQAIGTVVGTPINQIAAAFASTTCTVFWDSLETADSLNASFSTKKNTVTTANVVGTQSTFVFRIGVASRAFSRDGRVYVWLVFAEDDGSVVAGTPLGIRAALQNTYFLYRDDGLIVAKAVWQVAGGYSPSTGRLPGIDTTSATGYAWAGAFRRSIDLGGDRGGYGARALTDIAFSFDTTDARRSASIGRTLYISGGLVQQFDGIALAELGFLVTPWTIAVQDSGVAGNIAAGTYSWKGTYRFTNGQGETERSTTATGVQLTFSASHFAILSYKYLHVTNKTTRLPSVELWRTAAGAPADAPFYLITGQDPNTVTGDNHYIPNDSTTSGTTINDNFSDATLTVKEANPENGGVLESLAPPGATIIVATETRLLLAGVSGDPDGVWYSRERGDGEIASFNDVLRFEVPPTGGRITALWVDDQFVYVARETAIYAFAGPGLDNAGAGQNYTLVRTISEDVGVVSQEAHARTPVGRLLKSSKGWYVLDGGGQLRYVGGQVSSFDADTVVAVDTITAKHQVRILTTSRLLLWDYRGLVATTNQDPGRWAEWTVTGGLGAVLYNGVYTYLTATGPKQEQAAFTGLTYGIDAETSWIKLNDLAGYGKLGEIQLLGEFRSSCLVRMRVARDYQYDGAGNPVYFDDFAWAPSPMTVGSALQVRHRPSSSNGWGEAFKIRITAVSEASRATLATASALSTAVQTSGANWAATWKVADQVVGRESSFRPGEMGNAVTMSIAFRVGATPSIDVREHFAYNPANGRWGEDLYNIGVLVTGTTTTTVAQLEAAIAAGTTLATLQTADATPTKTLAIATMAALSPAAGSFSGGAYGSPTGEAIKLTGLALEVGLQPGLNRRLPAAQKAG